MANRVEMARGMKGRPLQVGLFLVCLIATQAEAKVIRPTVEAKVTRRTFFPRFAKDLNLNLDKNDQMKEVQVSVDFLGYFQSRHRQYFKGLEVIGAEYIVQEKGGQVDYAAGKVIPNLSLDIRPRLSEEEALKRVRCKDRQACAWQKHPENFVIAKKGLAISSKNFQMTPKSARLVWRFSISHKNRLESRLWEIDANNAQVVNRISEIYRQLIVGGSPYQPFSPGSENRPCSGASWYNGQVTFTCLKEPEPDGRRSLRCKKSASGPSCPVDLNTLDGRKPNPQTANPDITTYFWNNVLSDDFQALEDKVGVSAHWGASLAIAYFSRFGWLGFDGSARVQVNTLIQDKAGAYYGGGTIQLDGGGLTPGQSFGVSVDAVGHEFTHGVIVHSSGLIPQGESGALGEGFSDIFGEMIERYALGQCDWKVGTGVVLNGAYLRDLADPSSTAPPHPDTYTAPFQTNICDEGNDQCQIHHFGTIPGHWFYLLVNGGTGTNDRGQHYNVAAIGYQPAEQILFRTITTKLVASSGFMDARLGTIAAATDLFQGQSNQGFIVENLINAWHAVGVGEPADPEGEFAPAPGTLEVYPWPVTLRWRANASDRRFQVEISTSPQFDKDLQTRVLAGQRCSSSNVPLDLGEEPEDTQLQPGRGTGSRASPSNGGCEIYTTAQFDLKPETHYYWQVRLNSMEDLDLPANWRDWSGVRDFKTDVRMPTLIWPLDQDLVANPWAAELKWEEVGGAKSYWLYTSESAKLPAKASAAQGGGTGLSQGPGGLQSSPGLASELHRLIVDPQKPENREGSTIRLKKTLPYPLKVNHTYYWGVLPYGPKNIEGSWSNHGQAQVFKTSLPETSLESPSQGAKVSPWDLALKWKKTPGAIGYRLRVYRESDPGKNLYSGADPTSESKVIHLSPSSPAPGATERIYWTVTPKGPPPWNQSGKNTPAGYFLVDWDSTRPLLEDPADGDDVAYKAPTKGFVWSIVPKAKKYHFFLYRQNGDGSCGPLIDTQDAPADNFNFAETLVVYSAANVAEEKIGRCWQVEAVGPGDALGARSEMFRFNIGGSAVTMLEPPNQATNVEYDSTEFVWENEYAPYGFRIVIDEAATGQRIVYQTLDEKRFTIDLKPGTQYKWYVLPLGASGMATTGGASWTFTTEAEPCPTPAPPAIVFPKGKAGADEAERLRPNSGNNCSIQLQWGSVAGATQYEVVLNRLLGLYSTPQVIHQTTYTGTSSNAVLILPTYNHNWKVRAKNSCGKSSGWNTSDKFICYPY